MVTGRRQFLMAASAMMLWRRPAWAGTGPLYLRLGTGPAGESHFPMGGLIAGALSNPPGTTPCDRGGSCGVPGLIVAALSTSGSVTNVLDIARGRLDMALVQSDIAFWATKGSGPFEGHAVPTLRAIAQLYPDRLHIVARRELGLKSPRDIRTLRVSLGEKGSGTLVHARQILSAWGIGESTLGAQYLRAGLASDAMAAGRLDAFFVLDGIPTPAVAELARLRPLAIIPVSGTPADGLRRSDPLLTATEIPGGTYDGIAETVATLQIGLSLVASTALADDLVHAVCRALWQRETVAALEAGQPQGAFIGLSRAVTGLGAPLHQGAAQYYSEQGIME